MMHVAIMKYDKKNNNKLEKYMDFATQAEAQAHVDRFIDKYPSAFVGEVPYIGCMKYWIIDGEAKTIIYDSDTEKFDQSERAKTQYQRDRKESYPPATDYLDGIVKGDQGQIDKYIADCLAIKEKFPKE